MLSEHAENRSWYAVYVRSHFEKTTEQCLKAKGYQAFSPFYQTSRKRSQRTKTVDLPLFPGYVFCYFNPFERLPILITPGVVHVVGAGNVPEPLKLVEVNAIRMAVESGRPLQPWGFLRTGQAVRIKAGPLSGIEGILLKVKNEFRLVLSITLLQRSMAVEVDQDVVQPLFGTQRNLQGDLRAAS